MKTIFIAFFLMILALKNYGQAEYLTLRDMRTVADLPGDFKFRVSVDFKQRSIAGIPGSSPYSAIMTVAPWFDHSGGKNHQMAFSDDGIFHRTGNQGASEWDPWNKFVTEDAAGNVGIGTTLPKERLSVNGRIRAQEVKVEMANWPDYVFAKNYQLPTIEEVKQHVKDKGHLPGIPTASEVKMNGIDLGDMNAKLLKKIEEMTLYLIELNALVKNQQTEINNLKKK
jgi:hypothetical protein